MSDQQQRKIIRRWTLAASGLGAVLGPGLDAAPLLSTWVVGFINLAADAGHDFDEAFVRASLAPLFAGFVQWYISGRIAQAVVAALTGAAFAAVVGTAGLGIFVAAALLLSTNVLINALFTYKFLATSSRVLQDPSKSQQEFFDTFTTLILRELTDIMHIGDDIAAMLKMLFGIK